MKHWLVYSISITLVIVVLYVTVFGWRVATGKMIARNTQPFAFALENPTQRILIVGDSTAYGTGAETPAQSTAGYFHRDFPAAEIVNLSKNGAKIENIRHMLNTATGRFDLVILHAGANDIIYFTPLATTQQQMDTLLKDAKKYSNNVLLLTSGNIGAAPIFMPPLSWIYTARAKTFLAAFKKVAIANDVIAVNLFLEKKEDIYRQDIKKYYAADRLHLTGEGYYVWYQQIRKTMTAAQINL